MEPFAPPERRGLHGHFDSVVARWSARQRLFELGWGDKAFLARVRRGEERFESSPACRVAWETPRTQRGLELTDGTFASPRPFSFPESVSLARVRRVRVVGTSPSRAVVVLAGSREEGFSLRHWVWNTVVQGGVAGYFLENPCFGTRRLPDCSSAIPTVSQHLQMNLASVAEASALLASLDTYRSRAVAGYSMGGYMAGVTAAVTRLPLAVAVLAGGISAAEVFTQSVLSRAVAFDVLQRDCPPGVDARTAFAELFGKGTVTDLPVPERPDAVSIVGCADDAFVAVADARSLHRHWPGSSLDVIPAGHVSAVLLHRHALHRALLRAFSALERDATVRGRAMPR